MFVLSLLGWADGGTLREYIVFCGSFSGCCLVKLCCIDNFNPATCILPALSESLAIAPLKGFSMPSQPPPPLSGPLCFFLRPLNNLDHDSMYLLQLRLLFSPQCKRSSSCWCNSRVCFPRLPHQPHKALSPVATSTVASLGRLSSRQLQQTLKRRRNLHAINSVFVLSLSLYLSFSFSQS